MLYIGVGNQFAEYPVEYTGELDENGQIPPEEVLAAMASLTGWNLDLAEPIFSGKGGITVSFADTSALFAGPPEEQREEFHVYDALQLDQTILDSLKKTLQCWAVDPELGDPDQVEAVSYTHLAPTKNPRAAERAPGMYSVKSRAPLERVMVRYMAVSSL